MHFNSIKVRLEHSDGTKDTDKFIFQFHKGTIRTLSDHFNKLSLVNFNSIKVRLEPGL